MMTKTRLTGGSVLVTFELVQLLHGAGAEQRTGDTRVRDGERHGEVGHRQPRFFGEWDQLLHRVEAPLITERQREELRADDVVVLPAADAAGEHALTEWAPGEDAHAVLLRDRKHLTLDAAVQDRVRRLLGTEPVSYTHLTLPT